MLTLLDFITDLKQYTPSQLHTLAEYYNIPLNTPILILLRNIALHIVDEYNSANMSTGIKTFIIKYLPLLQHKEVFANIDRTFIIEIIDLAKQLDNVRMIKDKERKIAESKRVSESEKTLVDNYKQEWQELSRLITLFNIPNTDTDDIVKMYLNDGINIDDIQTKLAPAVLELNWLQKQKLTTKKLRDFSSLTELLDFLDSYDELKKKSEEKAREAIAIQKGREGGELIFEDENIRIIRPTTKEGAIYYGRGTKWCTAATTSENLFEDYNKKGSLFIVLPKNPTYKGEKYQLHFDITETSNEKNKPVYFWKLLEKYPKIRILGKYIKNPVQRYILLDDPEKLKAISDQWDLNTTIEYVDIFRYAILNGSINTVEYLYSKGPNLSFSLERLDKSILEYAVFSGNIKILKFLIQQGVDPFEKYNGRDVLMFAAEYGDLDMIKFIYDLFKHTNHNPIGIDNYDISTLTYAIRSCNIKVVKFFLKLYEERGIDPFIKSKDGKTLLMYAVVTLELDIVKLIYNLYKQTMNVFDINEKDNDGHTALIEAIIVDSAAEQNVDIVKFLIEKGADMDKALHFVENNVDYDAWLKPLQDIKSDLKNKTK